MERLYIRIGGCVQGVGYRYYATYSARRLGLTGWVKNLWDGRVEMEVQGTEDEIRRLIQGLQEGPYIRIEGMEAENLPLKEEEREFRETW